MEILDIHTHHPAPQPLGVINLRIIPEVGRDLELMPGQLYSVGVHPWDVKVMPGVEFWNKYEENAAVPDVVAIGECGVDLMKNSALFLQLQVFRKQIEISERLCKPMILHTVKSLDIICGLRRDLKPKMPWIIHGYRGKPDGALQLVKAGCYIGFGEKFNPGTLCRVQDDRILAETDESSFDIEEIICGLSDVKGFDLTSLIKENSKKFLNFDIS